MKLKWPIPELTTTQSNIVPATRYGLGYKNAGICISESSIVANDIMNCVNYVCIKRRKITFELTMTILAS